MPQAMVESQAALNRATDPFLADHAMGWVKARRQEFVQLRESHERRWARNWNAFYNRVPRSYYNGRAQVTPPDIQTRVELLVPRLEAMTIGRSDFFEPRPRTPSEARKARLNRELMMSQLEGDGFRANFGSSFLRDVIVYGTGAAKLGWRYEVDYRTWVEAGTGTLDPSEPGYTSPYGTVEKPCIINSPHAEPRDLFDIYADPRVDWPEETDIIEDCQITLGDLRRMVAAGLADASVVARILAAPVSDTTREGQGYRERRDAASGTAEFPRVMRHAMHVRYQEFWGEFPIDLRRGEDEAKAPTVQCVLAVVNEQHVVRISKNPYRGGWKPYEFPKIVKVRGELYGKSPVEAALELWVEKRDTRNMVLDTRAYNIQPMFTADPGHRGTAYVAGLGKVLRGANLRQVQVLDNTLSGIRQEQVINKDLDDIFGTPPLLAGQELGGEGGATGAAIQDQNASVNIKGFAISLEETFFKRFLRKWHDLNQQYLDDVQALSVMGEAGTEWRYIYPEDVKGSFDFVMLGATQMQSRAVLGAQFFNATTVMQNSELMQKANFDWNRWYRTYFKEVLGFEHPELFVSPMERAGPVPTFAQTVELLLLGHKVTPDPRSNLVALYREMTFFIDGFIDRIESQPVRENVLDFYRQLEAAVQQMIRERAQKMEMLRMAMIGAGPPEMPQEEDAKGEGSRKKGPEQRDGKGMMNGRRLMASMSGGPQGGSRVP